MKYLIYCAPVLLLLLSPFYISCDSSGDKATPVAVEESKKVELSPRDQYLAEFTEFFESVVKIIEPVNDSASEAIAIKELKKLEPRAIELGKSMDQLKQAVSDDQEADNQLIHYLQDELQARLGPKLISLQAKFGKSKSTSPYPELLEITTRLEMVAMSD